MSQNLLQSIIDDLKTRVIADKYVIVNTSGIRPALSVLKDEGYTIHYAYVMDQGAARLTRILASPGVTYNEVYENLEVIDQ